MKVPTTETREADKLLSLLELKKCKDRDLDFGVDDDDEDECRKYEGGEQLLRYERSRVVRRTAATREKKE